MDRRVKPGDDGGVCGTRAAKARFPAENELIPALESGLIFTAPWSIEGVVDRDA